MSNGIGSINRLVPGLIEKLNPNQAETGKPDKKAEGNFTELFSNMLNSVNGLQKDAAQIQESFMNGDPVELHDVMIKAQEAGLAMDLLLEVRNKLLNAYTQVMQMPL
ncbi:MAG TPA: flagellar hook-basal body complex protein FliE [candidate division Zixibacteria bacterium]|nr:flagellar hook-basal body complex protein FliE [candidate division Zixibacteria bacterium]